MDITILVVNYTATVRRWLARSGHYLHNPPPGCLFAVGVLDGWHLVGLCLIGRPAARMLPQDGTVGEITRMYLEPGLPHGTASAVLRFAFGAATGRGIGQIIAYHDRARHSGCIYRKAGMHKAGRVTARPIGWASRDGRKATASSSKRRWSISI